jgi:cytochrome c-type biogenesis protein CcmH/NrfG
LFGKNSKRYQNSNFLTFASFSFKIIEFSKTPGGKMKKVEQVEIAYIKKSTAMLIAVICLAVGFLMGIMYMKLDVDKEEGVRKLSVPPQATAPQSMDRQGPMTQNTDAVLKLKQEVTAHPQNAEAWALLGHAYFDMNRYGEAIDAYKKFLELKPDNADVWTDLGVMYRRSGNPTEAVRAFNKAMEINPHHQQSRFNKGIVLMHDLNDPEGARQAWEELVKINPEARAPNGQLIKELIKKQ